MLETIAIYLEIKGENPFKISAYRKAAQALENDDRSLSEIEDFAAFKGIGKGTATVIQELLDTGTCSLLEDLKKEVPSGLISLLKIPGLGGKKIAKLYKELQVVDVNSLQQACERQQVRTLAGFGNKTEEKILTAIQEVGTQPERLPLPFMLQVAEMVEQKLENMEAVDKFQRAGSIRRLKESVKDLDFIIATSNPSLVREQLVSLEWVSKIVANGDTKVSLVLSFDYEVPIDFRLIEPESFITTLHHFTGSKDHNVLMRQLAKARGEKISEYGVENLENSEVKTFETEEAFFNHFGLSYIPPEMREGKDEVKKFTTSFPYIHIEDVQGDLHMHTAWSDGAFSLDEMVEATRKKGYRYIAITDHSQYLKVANGLTKDRLLRQREEIDKLNEKYKDFRIFSGVEMDILPDGTLDYEDEVLENLDLVIASIHSSFSQSKEQIMTRLKTAITNPYVDFIAHPTGRLLGRRSGYEVDMEQLIEMAKNADVGLELNANPNRLDLSYEQLKMVDAAGVKTVINTDAHNIVMLDDMEIGVGYARKAWLTKDNIINTWNIDKLTQFLNRNGVKKWL